MTDFPYVKDSFAGLFNEKEAFDFETWLNECGYDKIKLDRSYLNHLRHHHGGKPIKKYFQTKTGVGHVVTRFLNFADDQHPLSEYNVESTWSALSDRMSDHLIPFAELFGGDFVCFDYSRSGTPQIVVWLHEESRPDQPPATEPVARDFEEFLSILRAEPNK